MAWYRDVDKVKRAAHKEHWDAEHKPGNEVEMSGIYRCTGCDKEIAANKGDPFPPQNHHQHGSSKPPIRWQLLVRAETD